jgi:hypothetical protein
VMELAVAAPPHRITPVDILHLPDVPEESEDDPEDDEINFTA